MDTKKNTISKRPIKLMSKKQTYKCYALLYSVSFTHRWKNLKRSCLQRKRDFEEIFPSIFNLIIVENKQKII